ncbi:MAG: hypothetical protein ACFFCO_08755 [Promethearchaeota archaeon]
MNNISETFIFTDVDSRQYRNLLSALPLFQGERGILTLLYRESDGKILNAIHSHYGSWSDVTLQFTTPEDTIKQLKAKENVDAVILLEERLAGFLLAKLQAEYTSKMDFINYFLRAQEAVQEKLGIWFHVEPMEFWTQNVLMLFRKAQNLLKSLPNGLSLLAVFSGDKLWTSLLAQKTDGKLTQISTIDVTEIQGLRISDWRIDYEKLLELVQQRFGKPSLGVFTDTETFKFLLRSSRPWDFLQQARREEQIIINPASVRFTMRL